MKATRPAVLGPRTTPAERFWRKVDASGDCWEWTAGLGTKGYGQFSTHVLGVQTWHQAHRFAYELLVGAIPVGMQLDHLCRNHRCVNPDHLEPVTPRENLLRGHTNARHNAAKTHCKRGHPFAGYNIRITPKGGRACRTCLRDLARKYREARCLALTAQSKLK